jgi:hypothetical protein
MCFLKKFGRRIYVSKYQSVDEAVKWTEGYIKTVRKHHREWLGLSLTQGRGTGSYYELIGEVNILEENWDAIAKGLKTKLINKLDNKASDPPSAIKLDDKPKEKGGTLQRIRNFRKHKNEHNTVIKNDDKAVILKDTLAETLAELGLPTRPLNYLDEASIVTPDYFAGISGLGSNYQSTTYHSGQYGTNQMDSKTYQKLKEQSEGRIMQAKQTYLR